MNLEDLNKYEGAVLKERFVLGKVIGWGRYGSVLEANDRQSGKTVAVKMGNVGDRSVRFECKQYLKIKSCSHLPDLIDVIKFRTGNYCLVMSMEKESLLDYFVRTPSIPVPNIAIVMTEVLEGLRYLHGKLIVHRDIHMGNILLPLGPNKAKLILTDLGSSARMEKDGEFRGIINPERMVPAFCTPLFVTLGHKHVESDDVFSLAYVALILHRSSTTQSTRDGFQLIKQNLYDDLNSTLSADSRDFYDFFKEINRFRPAVNGEYDLPNYENLQSIIRRIPGFDENVVL